MNKKTIILGARAGTSVLVRLLQGAGIDVWCTTNSTEPPYIQGAILNNLDQPKKIKKALSINTSDWQVAKLPEFSFILPMLDEMYPNAQYIWMHRPIEERVKSHVNLGWHWQIHERLINNNYLRAFVEMKTNSTIRERDAEHSDWMYFLALDECTSDFLEQKKGEFLAIRYDDFNGKFNAQMKRVAEFLEIRFFDNIDTWKQIKSVPHQAGRWQKSQY